MNRQNVAEFHGGPLDGTRRLQSELPSVYVEPIKEPTTASPATTTGTPQRAMVYMLRGDPTTGRPGPDADGLYQYDFRGYRFTG
ncbi:hypothetical protein [Micromonospora sp. H61]|uniref:hypothetical protein n=1 Tax=unclassified Micromonospora TaxID=2617518 RepID=UPI001B36D896|nr:hypothetical protein [Micromonospora sp. H61]MBQ0993520.1 hypothetical protein [Micromonospora sp. H61]